MKIWRAIIVDDEPLARFEIKRLLSSYNQVSVIGEADSVPSARKVIESLLPDLVFLDIDLGTQSGFDLLEVVEHNFHTIFVTAYDKYAIRAFEINALDYLLKPVHPDRINESVKRLGNPFKNKLHFKLKPYDKILINNLNRSKFITISSINYIEAKGDYTKICIADGFTGLVHQTITKWMERLPPDLFIQVHRSYIINISHIQEIEKKQTGNYNVKLKHTKIFIPVSRNHLKKIKSRYRID